MMNKQPWTNWFVVIEDEVVRIFKLEQTSMLQKMDSRIHRWLNRPITHNGGSGVHICFPDGTSTSLSIPAGSPVTNYKAEFTA
jgi:hypothetical protein